MTQCTDEEYIFELTVTDKVGNESVLSIPLVYKPESQEKKN